MKKETTFKYTNSAFGTVEGVAVIVTREYFRNGETHCKGYYAADPKKKFDVPSVFVNT